MKILSSILICVFLVGCTGFSSEDRYYGDLAKGVKHVLD
jgi:hypothetical protein